MADTRLSANQKEILIRLYQGVTKGQMKLKSTFLNAVINKTLEKEVHPNHFRGSCRRLEESGLIMRKKEDLEWYINITPAGFDQAEAIIDEQNQANHKETK